MGADSASQWGMAAAAGMVVWIACLGAGFAARVAAQRLCGRDGWPAPHPGHDVVAGFPLLGTLCFLVGIVSVSPLAMALMLTPATLLGLAGARRVRAMPLPPLRPRSWAEALACGAVVVLVGIAAVLAALPPYGIDELAYHAAIPKIWSLEGRVVDLPLLSHSYFPLGTESATLPLFAWLGTGAGRAAHVLHFGVFLAVLYEIGSWLSARAPRFAWSGVAAVAATPALILTSGLCGNDWAVLGCAALLFASLDDAARDVPGSRARVATAVAAGMLAKYSFGLVLAALGSAALWNRRGADAGRFGALVRALAAGGAAGSVFVVRNLLATGNPFAPFLQSHAPAVAGFGGDATGVFATALAYVWDPQMTDESLGGALILLALTGAGCLRSARGEFARAGWVAVSLVGAGLALARPSARILAPFLVVAAMAGAAMLERAGAVGADWVRRGASSLVALLAALQTMVATDMVRSMEPGSAFSGAPGAPAQFVRGLWPDFATIEWFNERLPAGSRTLVLGIHELFYFDRPVRGGGNFDGPRIAAFLGASSADALLEALRVGGITHLAISRRRLLVGSPPGAGPAAESWTILDPAAAENLRQVVTAHGTLVADDGGRLLYRLSY